MKKICITCGREFDGYPTGKECFSCHEKSRKAEMKQAISSGEITQTDGETDIVCPWCGEAFESDGEDSRTYTDGGYEYCCPECGKTFYLETTVSITYSTSREIPVWIEREKKLTELYRNANKYSKEEFERLRNELMRMR